MRNFFRAACMILALASLFTAQAQTAYPSKPIRLIVPQPPGGIADHSARVISQALSESLGKPVLVDNRAGASGNIAAEIAAKAPADGYTLLWAYIAHAINVTMYDKSNYDLVRDLAPVSHVLSAPYALVAHPALPAKSVKELVALAKARPNQVDFASSASPSYLAGLLFMQSAGIQLTHVPYKGGGPAITALLGGEVQIGFPGLVGALPHIKSGKLRGLGVTSLQRSAAAPDIPSVNEAGVKGYEATTWYGLMVPSGTQRQTIVRLNDEMSKVLKRPDVRERFAAAGADATGSTPEQFAAYIGSEIQKWGKLVKSSGARPD